MARADKITKTKYVLSHADVRNTEHLCPIDRTIGEELQRMPGQAAPLAVRGEHLATTAAADDTFVAHDRSVAAASHDLSLAGGIRELHGHRKLAQVRTRRGARGSRSTVHDVAQRRRTIDGHQEALPNAIETRPERYRW